MQAVKVSANGDTVPVDLDSELAGVVVQADKRRLARVVANLLDNAREVRRRRDERACLPAGRTRACRSPSRTTGPACPPRSASVIFERFARGGGAGRRGSGEGVGLGLALVDEHVRLHGGRVWVEDRRTAEQAPGSSSSCRCWRHE